MKEAKMIGIVGKKRQVVEEWGLADGLVDIKNIIGSLKSFVAGKCEEVSSPK